MAKVKTLNAGDAQALGFMNKSDRVDITGRKPAAQKPVKKQPAEPVKKQPAEPVKKQPAEPVQKIAAAERPKTKLKVAAYCRVSTQLESQQTSITSQRKHYKELIASNPDWELAGIYLEAGISGTKAEIRPELQKLLAACRNKEVDLVLTKSISRFSRNTSDCLEMVRTLTDLGVAVRFEKERIDTGTMESEFFLTVLACLAQDESQSISGNMKLGIRMRFQNGTYRQSALPYGYDRTDEGMTVKEAEAEVVRRIFTSYLSGMGCNQIADMLNADGIPARAGGKWLPTVIKQMIVNEAYKGDRLMQKTYREDFKPHINTGELDQYYEENHHEAIIPEEMWEKAQQVKDLHFFGGAEHEEKKVTTGSRYAFSGKLVCKNCGKTMYRTVRKYYVVYLCKGDTNVELEDSLKAAFLTCLNKLAFERRIVDGYIRSIRDAEAERHAERIAELNAALEQNRVKTETLHAAAVIDKNHSGRRAEKVQLMHEEKIIKDELQRLMHSTSNTHLAEELQSFIRGWKPTMELTDFPDDDFRRLIDHADVKAGEEITFHFACGLMLTESLRSRPEPVDNREYDGSSDFRHKGCRLPYGYRMLDGVVVPDPMEASALKLFFENYLAGLSVENARNAAGVTVTAATCRNILKASIYTGEGRYPRIIEPDVMEEAMRIRSARAGARKGGRGGQKVRQAVMARMEFEAPSDINSPTAMYHSIKPKRKKAAKPVKKDAPGKVSVTMNRIRKRQGSVENISPGALFHTQKTAEHEEE